MTEQLINIYNETFYLIPENKWKYFHKESIKNFIVYSEKIKGKSEK